MVDRVKKMLRRESEMKQSELDTTKLFLSTGSTCLNLACTGDPDKGFAAGHFYWLVGDSDSGKTFLSMTCFAEACINPEFDDYRIIYDAPEGGALMDIRKFFGRRVAERLEAPRYGEDGDRMDSQTIQDFYFNVDDANKKGKPYIYVLDSHDCLSSKEEADQFAKMKVAMRKGRKTDEDGKKLKGSYGDGKAKFNSSNLRTLMGPLAKSGSILIVISQTRDSFDPFVDSTVSGGRALKFYATLQLWSSQAGKIKKRVNKRDRVLGTYCKVRIKKNRVVGRDRSVVVPIYTSVGIDDVGGCVDYLVSEGVWKKKKEESDNSDITVTGLGPDQVLTREETVQMIEEEGLFPDLKELVRSTWEEIEQKCTVKRKSRYE